MRSISAIVPSIFMLSALSGGAVSTAESTPVAPRVTPAVLPTVSNAVSTTVSKEVSPVASADDNDIVIKAMKDELERSMKTLKLPNKPAPYFVIYRVADEANFRFAYTNGSLMYDWRDDTRTVAADVRVGDYDYDNTADVDGDTVSEVAHRNTSLDDNFSVIRRSLWDATDQAYKSASESFEKMVSYKKQHSIPNLCESYSREKPVTMIKPVSQPLAIPEEWKDRIKKLSLIINETGGVRESWIAFQATQHTRRLVTSEGTTVRDSYNSLKVGMAVFARCPDGDELWDSESVSVNRLDQLPAMDVLEEKARTLAQRLVKHASAPIKDYYLGPVLLSPQSTAEFTLRNVAPLLCAVKGDNLRPQGTFLRSLKCKVMSSFINITDDPHLREFDNNLVAGVVDVDGEGVPCQKVRLVEHGFLMDLLSGRSPVIPGKHSNGHDFSGTVPTTLLLESVKPIAESSLREKLKTLAREHGLSEYLIIRRIRPSTPLFLQGSTCSTRESSLEGEEPVEAVMVSVSDGQERRVRGLKFKELYKPSLQDVIGAGSDVKPIKTTLWNGQLRTVICPSLLLSKIEMEADSRPTDSPYPVKRPTVSD